eukprot:TRINITY_DN4009_c0_g2_i1.p1 TRINITY_DN4009_c0_g2~~TRINITY_DN4009_c0_g2_i1.p1  ORF type:complete len:252 (-),score=60.15 TRINITY_DN4009_c0_g2_i1:132-821(-)
MAERPSSTLFVANLPDNIELHELETLFSTQPGYLRSRIHEDRNSNMVGFVEFDTVQDAAEAKERFHNFRMSDLDGELIVQFSNPKRRRPPQQARVAEPMGASYSNVGVGVGFMGGMAGGAMTAPPPDSASTLYIEGLPLDATEREVSHIFRPYAGYQSCRILVKQSKQHPSLTFLLCFVEFDTCYQSTIAMHSLQGYRIDQNDTKGLTISYARSDRRRAYRPQEHDEME